MKRFTETEKWSDPWFRKLTPPAKLLWYYLLDKCDHAGVIEIDLESASFHIGYAIKPEHLAELESRLKPLYGDKTWIVGFVKFQFGKLSRDCRPHASVFSRLDFHGISPDQVDQADSFKHGVSSNQRARIIARDGLVCLYTGNPIPTGDEAEIDHLIPRSKGGLNKDDNLFVASKAMNQLRKDRDIELFCHVVNIPFTEVLKRVNERLTKGSITLKDKDKEKEKEKEKEECGKPGKLDLGDTYHKDSRTALHLLNEGSGKNFRETDTNLSFISARLSEQGVTIEGVRQMLARQCKQWKGTKFADYLRPETLFNKTKFDGYYAAKDQPVINENISASGSKGFDRNRGTLNEGHAADYDLKAIQAARAVRDARKSEPGTNA